MAFYTAEDLPFDLMACQLCGGWATPQIWAESHAGQAYAECMESGCRSPHGKPKRVNFNWVHDLEAIALSWNRMQAHIAKDLLCETPKPTQSPRSI